MTKTCERCGQNAPRDDNAVCDECLNRMVDSQAIQNALRPVGRFTREGLRRLLADIEAKRD
jgi:ribosomal protein S26